MKKEKLGLFLILLGNLLYLSYIYFSGNETGNFVNFKPLIINDIFNWNYYNPICFSLQILTIC